MSIDVKKMTYGYDYHKMTIGELHELLQAEQLTDYDTTLKQLILDVSVTLLKHCIDEVWNTSKPQKPRKIHLPENIEV